MSPLNFTHILTQAVDELSESESYKGLFHQHTDGNSLGVFCSLYMKFHFYLIHTFYTVFHLSKIQKNLVREQTGNYS